MTTRLLKPAISGRAFAMARCTAGSASAQAVERPDYLAEHFARASTVLGYKIDPPEPMVDAVGRIAATRDSSLALKLFEMNATLYPASANAHLVLGNYWLAKKDSSKALGHYEKAVSLRPASHRAQEMVRKLKATR